MRPGPMKLDAHFGKDVEAMAVQIEVAGEWMTARLVGEIDHHGARELREAIDSAVLAQYCDGAVMVIDADTVSYRLAQRVKEQLEKSGCKILGAVLNKYIGDDGGRVQP